MTVLGQEVELRHGTRWWAGAVSGWVGPLVTAILAVVVFVAGQAVLRFVLEPIQEYKKLIGEVAHALLFYANAMPRQSLDFGDGPVAAVGADQEELDEARKHLRGLSGRIRESIFHVPHYEAIALLGVVPKKGDALEAATQLVGWSNSIGRKGADNVKRRRIIADKLGITRRLGKLE